MTNNRPVVLFLLSLAFLFLLTVPLALIFGHYSGLLSLPKFVTYRNVSAAVTAGLFIIPVLMVFLAAVIVAVKKQRLAIPSAAVSRPVARKEAVRYPWEGMFGSEEREEHVERRKPLPKLHAPGSKLRAAAAVIIAVVVLLALLMVLQQKGAFVSDANKIVEEKPAVVEVKPQQNLTPFQFSATAKKVVDSARGFAGKIKGGFAGSVSKVKSAAAKVPSAAWQGIAIAVLVLLFAGTLFYSRKTQQLGSIPDWVGGWAGWLLGIFSYAGKNRLKALLWAIAAVVACAVIVAVAFGRQLKVKLPALPAVSMPGIANSAANALLAVKDFVSVYRSYIAIGIFALLAIIGILVALEKRGKG